MKTCSQGLPELVGEFGRLFGFSFGKSVDLPVTEVAPRPSRLGDSYGGHERLSPGRGGLCPAGSSETQKFYLLLLLSLVCPTNLWSASEVPRLHLVLETQTQKET